MHAKGNIYLMKTKNHDTNSSKSTCIGSFLALYFPSRATKEKEKEKHIFKFSLLGHLQLCIDMGSINFPASDKLHNFLLSPFIVLQIILFVKTLSKEQKLLPPKRKKEKKKNKVC